MIAVPGGSTPAEFGAVWIARVSFGPWPLRVVLTTLGEVGTRLLAGEPLPS